MTAILFFGRPLGAHDPDIECSQQSHAERTGNGRKRSGDKKAVRAIVLGAVKARLRFHLDRACARWPIGWRRAAGRLSQVSRRACRRRRPRG